MVEEDTCTSVVLQLLIVKVTSTGMKSFLIKIPYCKVETTVEIRGNLSPQGVQEIIRIFLL